MKNHSLWDRIYLYNPREYPPPPGRNSYFVLLFGIHTSKFKQTTTATGTSPSPNKSYIIFEQSKCSKPLRKSSSQWPFLYWRQTHYTSSGRTWASIYSIFSQFIQNLGSGPCMVIRVLGILNMIVLDCTATTMDCFMWSSWIDVYELNY